MSANINSTITETVSNLVGDSAIHLYGDAITAVSKALEEREYTIRETIVEKARDLGYGSEADDILNAAGVMERPAPEPEPVVEAPVADESEESGDKLDKVISALGSLSETVGKLVSAAERNGIRL